VKPVPSRPPPGPAPGTTQTKEDSWTPYQPTVAETRAAESRAAAAPTPPRPPRQSNPSQPPQPAAAPARKSFHSIPPEVAAAPPLPALLPPPPAAVAPPPDESVTHKRLDSIEDITVDAIEPGEPSDPAIDIEPEPETSPRVAVPSTPLPPPSHAASPGSMPAAPPIRAADVPSPPAAPAAPVRGDSPGAIPQAPPITPLVPVNIKDLPPMRALAPTEPEALEVQFEDEESASGPRASEPEAEVEPEDMMSVESAPVPAASPVVIPIERTSQNAPTPVRAFTPAAMLPITGVGTAPASSTKSMPPPPKGQAPASVKGQSRVIMPTASPLAPPAMTDSLALQGGRRKARPWWEELFNDDFIRTMAKITDDQVAKEVDFIEESLAVAKGAMLLDLACGTGRHAIELTRRGYKVVGFDLSLPMLARAAEEAQERGQKLNFVQGDMREMTFEDTFDGIYCWATSFGFFEEDKNAAVVAKVHKALKKGGQFLLDVVNRDFVMRQAPSLAWFEGEGCICMDEMSIDWITSRMKVKRTMMMDDGRTKEIDYSVRVYSLHELGKVLHEAGFRVAEVSGRCATPGVFFGNESPRTMILAEKK
jgi:SAM-dependent methyltransferase